MQIDVDEFQEYVHAFLRVHLDTINTEDKVEDDGDKLQMIDQSANKGLGDTPKPMMQGTGAHSQTQLVQNSTVGR